MIIFVLFLDYSRFASYSGFCAAYYTLEAEMNIVGLCSKCGGRVTTSLDALTLICQRCGSTKERLPVIDMPESGKKNDYLEKMVSEVRSNSPKSYR